MIAYLGLTTLTASHIFALCPPLFPTKLISPRAYVQLYDFVLATKLDSGDLILSTLIDNEAFSPIDEAVGRNIDRASSSLTRAAAYGRWSPGFQHLTGQRWNLVN